MQEFVLRHPTDPQEIALRDAFGALSLAFDEIEEARDDIADARSKLLKAAKRGVHGLVGLGFARDPAQVLNQLDAALGAIAGYSAEIDTQLESFE